MPQLIHDKAAIFLFPDNFKGQQKQPNNPSFFGYIISLHSENIKNTHTHRDNW